MGKSNLNLSPEQQELLDSGLRMLAHMIAETHIRRTALRKKSVCAVQSKGMNDHSESWRAMPEESSCKDQSEDHDE